LIIRGKIWGNKQCQGKESPAEGKGQGNRKVMVKVFSWLEVKVGVTSNVKVKILLAGGKG
jgi:hypothetical protein